MILWIDDDSSTTLKPFIDEVRDAGYETVQVANPDEMWAFLEDNSQRVSAIIMDIMLPTGERVKSDESRMGLLTGLILLKEIKKRKCMQQIPLIIFTILRDQHVIDWAREHGVPFLLKQETYARELLEKIKEGNIEPDRQ